MYIPWIELISFLILGALCAAIAQALAGFSWVGYFAALAASFFGAWGATWLARILDLPGVLVITLYNESFPVVWAVIGGLLLALAVSLFLQRLLIHTIKEVVD